MTTVPAVPVASLIRVVRGVRVILDADLARVYGVETRTLNQAVRRNADRFPEDFAFTLTKDEVVILRSQIVISSDGHGGRRALPLAFTEHGAIMAASVLNSPQAVAASVAVVRAFVALRKAAGSIAVLARRLDALERKMTDTDENVRAAFAAIRALMDTEAKPTRKIGFTAAHHPHGPKTTKAKAKKRIL
jgi:hypothetical protein